MHPCLLKVKVRMRRDCRKTFKSTVYVSLAICKAGVPSVYGGDSAVDTFTDIGTDAIRQRTCKGCALVGGLRFSASHRF